MVRLRATSAAIALPVKLKLLLSFALITAQIGDVYQVRYPDGYASLTDTLFSPLRLELFGWIPGLHLSCIGIHGLQNELLMYSLLPFGVVLAALGYCRARGGSMVAALPFVLRFTYILYPSVSSKGFQALGQCDCFKQLNTTSVRCYLPADVSVECDGNHAPSALLAVGALAVGLFGIGVPLLYACLLYACRLTIQNGEETPLSASLAFLHISLHPWALWWPLIEAARALLLTGFLALIEPGELFQMLCGLVVAFAFSILQIWFIPYRTASNNFVEMLVNVSLVLTFVSSLGVQINAQYDSNINPELLSAMLYVTALVMFPIMLLSLLLELCRPAALAPQLRARLLEAEAGEQNDAVADSVQVEASPHVLVQ